MHSRLKRGYNNLSAVSVGIVALKMSQPIQWLQRVAKRIMHISESGEENCGRPEELTPTDLKRLLWSTIRKQHRLTFDDNVLHVIWKFLEIKWRWNSYYNDYSVSENGLILRNVCDGDSNWSRWAFTNSFPREGRTAMSIKIDQKRPEKGWIGLGVIRSSYAEAARLGNGGFEVYSQHAIFVDPSWDNHESHFNLISLDVQKQSTMGTGATICTVVDNDRKSIEFFYNEETTPFAVGDWSKINYEEVCGYVILTTKNDQVTIQF